MRSALVVAVALICLTVAPRSHALTMSGSDSYPVGSGPVALAAADLNGDGVKDVVALNGASDSMTTLLGDGAGLEVVSTRPTVHRPVAIAPADMNGDGKTDIVGIGSANGYVTMSWGDGTGAFPSAIGYKLSNYGLQALAVAELNGDGRPDVIIDAYTGIRSYLQATNGSFTAVGGSPFAGNGRPSALAVGDLNGDAARDVVAVSASYGTVCVFRGSTNGSFALAGERTIGGRPSDVVLGDVNGDGRTDAAVTKPDSGDVTVLLGDGASNLNEAPGSPVHTPAGASRIALGDMNADAKPDLLVASGASNSVSVLLGDGSGRFTAAAGSPYPVTGAPSAVAALDVNGDGVDDAVMTRASTDDVMVISNDSAHDVAVSPDEIDFGEQGAGTASPVRTITANGSGLATPITGVASDSDAFVITDDRCTGRSVGDGYGSCDVDVRFTPADVGDTIGTLTFATEDGDTTVALFGAGTDIDPPDTTITAHPDDPTTDARATFAFESDEPDSIFECAMDGDAYADCESPWTSDALSAGSHVFDVRAVDAAGNVDPSPATWTFTVDVPDTQAPQTTITEHPDALTADTTPTFRFVSDEPNSTFLCGIDGASATACASPFTGDELGEGSHRFTVAATDAAGNADPDPDNFSFTVDVTKPHTTIVGRARMRPRNARFVFRFSEDVKTIWCSVDGSGYSECRTPYGVRAYGRGRHILRVQAVDIAGNIEAVPVVKRFTIVRR